MPMLVLVSTAVALAAIAYAWRLRRALQVTSLAYDALYGEFLEAMAVSQSREDLRARASQLFRDSADQVDDLIARLSRAGAEIERLRGALDARQPTFAGHASQPSRPMAECGPSRREMELQHDVQRLKEALAQAAPDEVWARRYKDAKRRFATTFHPDLLAADAPDRAARELAFKLFYDELAAISTS